MRYRMKISFVCERKSTYGGKEKYFSKLVTFCKEKNLNIEEIYSPFPKIIPGWLRAILFNIYLFLIKKNSFFFSLEKIINADIYRAGDGVHKYFFNHFKKSKINIFHYINIFLEKKCINNSKHIIANSIMTKKQIIEIYGIDENKISLVYNGVDKEEANSYKIESIRKELELSNCKVILFVGSGYKRKGVKEFLYILSQLSFKNFKALVVGKEKNMSFYKSYSEKLGLGSKVHFIGPSVNVAEFYEVSDIFLFPTHYEPFGFVVLEAMHHGNAIITTKKCGASEVLKNEYVMKSPSDPRVVNELDNLLDNEKLLGEIKRKNKEIAKKYSLQRNFNETLKVIDKHIN